MELTFNLLSYPVSLGVPRWRPAEAAGDSRLPLLMLVVALTRPQLVAEVGVGPGDTYAALCQAIQELVLPAQAFGLVLGAAGRAAPDAGFPAHHDALYGSFSRLLPAEASSPGTLVGGGEVDLLHLGEALSVAEARAAYTAWRPKLSARAVVLISGVGQGDRLAWWSELRTAYPRFELLQGSGLGLLAVGAEPPEALACLLKLPPAEQATLRALLFRLAQTASADADGVAPPAARALEQTYREQAELVDQLHARLEVVTAREREFRALYLDLHQQLLSRDQQALQASEKDHQIAARDVSLTALRKELSLAQSQLALAQSEIRGMQASRVWRWGGLYWRARYELLRLFKKPA
jgi:O-antigen biosynthesis protein